MLCKSDKPSIIIIIINPGEVYNNPENNQNYNRLYMRNAYPHENQARPWARSHTNIAYLWERPVRSSRYRDVGLSRSTQHPIKSVRHAGSWTLTPPPLLLLLLLLGFKIKAFFRPACSR